MALNDILFGCPWIFICFVTDNFNIPSFCGIFVSRLITSIETRNVRFFTFVFSVKGMISVILILLVAVYQQIFSNIEQGFIGLFRGNQTFITMFPPIVCLLTRYPCHCHSHTMNNSWVYVIYMSTTWNSTQVAYLCLSLLTCRHWLFERWIVLSTE